jgi:hypothetical protein
MCQCHRGIPKPSALSLLSQIEGSAIFRCEHCYSNWELLEETAWVKISKY